MAKRKRQSPSYRLHGRISNQVWQVIRNRQRCRKAFALLGYSAADLRAHLERQFLKGMSWVNMSEWHIDPNDPFSRFTITDPDAPELLRAWPLTTLRPLWAKHSSSKAQKMSPMIK